MRGRKAVFGTVQAQGAGGAGGAEEVEGQPKRFYFLKSSHNKRSSLRVRPEGSVDTNAA